MVEKKKRERAHRLGFRRWISGEDAVLELNVGDAPMVLGDDGDQDKMQNGEGSSVASTELSSSSWNADEMPLEELQVSASFGYGRLR
jgi:hypothetical protein